MTIDEMRESHSDYRQSHPEYRELVAEEDLRLIEPNMNHAEASLSWVESLDVIQYMGADFSHPTLEGEMRRIQDVLANDDEYSWMIECDGKVIGNVCINSIRETTQKLGAKAGNLTILIGAKDYWGKGLGSKVCAAVLDWAFDEGGFRAMGARALHENAASIKTLQKLGFEEWQVPPGIPHIGVVGAWQKNAVLEKIPCNGSGMPTVSNLILYKLSSSATTNTS